jgi:hypothetical protein
MDKPSDAAETTPAISGASMRAPLALTLFAAAGLLAACNQRSQPPEPPRTAQAPPAAPAPAPEQAPAPQPAALQAPTGFRHEDGFRATGYLMPLEANPVRVQNYRLANITLGAPSDFSEWEGGRRASEFGPVMLEFERQGGQTVNLRVLPTAYNVSSRTLSFAGTAPNLGPVVLQAQIDPAALRAAMNSGETTSQPVARGSLSVGGQRFDNLAFSYFAGD